MGGGKPPVVISSVKDEEADFVYNPEEQKLIGKKINFSLKTGIKDKNHFIEIELPIDPKTIQNIDAHQAILLVLGHNQHINEIKKTISCLPAQ